MDTPGFLDINLSESRITRMISKELDDLRASARTVVVDIFYLQPITDIRMGGSKREAIKLLRAFAESFGASCINVVTTMWNRVPTRQMPQANQRFECLKSEIFNKSGTMNCFVTKFDFSQESALAILDKYPYGWYHQRNQSGDADPLVQFLACENLLERIANTHQHLQILTEDKQNAENHDAGNHQLLEVLDREEQMTLSALWSCLDDLYDIGPSFCSCPMPGLEVAVPVPTEEPAILPLIPIIRPVPRPLARLQTEVPGDVQSPPVELTRPATVVQISTSLPASRSVPLPSTSRLKRFTAYIKGSIKRRR